MKLGDFTDERHTVNLVDLGQAAKEKLNVGILKDLRKAEAVLLINVQSKLRFWCLSSEIRTVDRELILLWRFRLSVQAG